jgi:predicted dehydrogenase
MSIPSDYYPVDERVEITGSEGTLLVDGCTTPVLGGPPLTLIRDGRVRPFEGLRHDWLDSFVDSTRHFVRCIRHGGEPQLTGQRGRAVLQFVLAALRSAETGRPERPDEVIA